MGGQYISRNCSSPSCWDFGGLQESRFEAMTVASKFMTYTVARWQGAIETV